MKGFFLIIFIIVAISENDDNGRLRRQLASQNHELMRYKKIIDSLTTHSDERINPK